MIKTLHSAIIIVIVPLMQGLQHPPSQKAKGAGRPLTLKSYKIANCSASAGEKATFVVRQLNVSPDPVVLPGTLTFQFDINVLTDLSDLQVQLLDFLIFFLLPLPIFIQILNSAQSDRHS